MPTPSSGPQSTIESEASSNPTMPPPASSPSLTLILAATPSLGIGKSGTLPWPQLRQEMAYFARVTKRVIGPTYTSGSPPRKRVNAVLMGRKTWESIPPKFRPLKDRLNVVITRGNGDFVTAQNMSTEGPIVASSLADAIAKVKNPAACHSAMLQAATTTHLQQQTMVLDMLANTMEVDRIFIIGGASMYRAALDSPQTKHVLLTKIKEEFECDTFFPVDLQKDAGWRETSKEELEQFVGEKVDGEIEEKGVKFEFCLFERV